MPERVDSKADRRTEDVRLCRRMAGGDAAALKTLYARHSGYAMAIALRVLRQEAEAEEVVQETFLEVWRRAREFDAERGDARRWIITITRSRAIDRLRSRGSAQRVEIAFADEPDGPSATPLEDVEERLRRDRVRAALSELPAEQRRALELAYFEGLTRTEIAERTGDPVGTVKSRIHLAMEKLAGLLGRIA